MSDLQQAANPEQMRQPASKREIFAWAMYDFANSGYSTVVSTAVYSAYFVEYVAGSNSSDSGSATLLWTVAVAISNLLIVLSAPVIGTIADYTAAKKRMLVVTTASCVLCTALLATTGPGTITLAMIVVILANLTYGTGEDLIAAFLPEISTQDKMGRTSAFGWTVGYIGGLVTLGICLAYVNHAQDSGQQAAQYVPLTMLIVAAIYGLASLPTFLWLKERAIPQALPHGSTYLKIGFRRLKHTLSESTRFQDLFRFLITLLCFTAGTSTVVVLAAVYAKEVMKFSTADTLVMILVVNVTAAVGAYASGHIQDRFGSVPTLFISLVLWLAATVIAGLTDSRAGFWVASNMIGIAMGWSQSAGRALVGQFSPPDRCAEFFGLWGLAIKLASIIGPISYGLVTYVSSGNHREALLFTCVYFILGIVLLLTVNEKRGKLAAQKTQL